MDNLKIDVDVKVTRKAPLTLADFESRASVDGLLYNANSEFYVGRVMRDVVYREDVEWNSTNAIFPFRPIEDDGRIRDDNKIIVRLVKYPQWWIFITDLLGITSAAEFDNPGDGNQDQNDKDIFVCDINADRKHMAATYAGCLLLIKELRIWHEKTYASVHTFNARQTPLRNENGDWLVDGNLYTPEKHPYLFATRTLIKKIDDDRWQTPDNCKLTLDKGADGKGDENWPYVTDMPAALSMEYLETYKKPEFDVILYKDSILEDGSLIEREGLRVTIDELAFLGNDVWGKEKETQRWYRMEQMLVRGSEEDKTAFGSEYDWRVYAAFPETPSLPYRSYRSSPYPEIGWKRPSL